MVTALDDGVGKVLQALRARMDPVFLPRPLHLVSSLPRNATGKLPRDALLQLAAQLERDSARDKPVAS